MVEGGFEEELLITECSSTCFITSSPSILSCYIHEPQPPFIISIMDLHDGKCARPRYGSEESPREANGWATAGKAIFGFEFGS